MLWLLWLLWPLPEAKGSFYANPVWDDPAGGDETVREKCLGHPWALRWAVAGRSPFDVRSCYWFIDVYWG